MPALIKISDEGQVLKHFSLVLKGHARVCEHSFCSKVDGINILQRERPYEICFVSGSQGNPMVR